MLQLHFELDIDVNIAKEIDLVAKALKELRVHVVKDEYLIHNEIKKILVKNNIGFNHEVNIGKYKRIDFLTTNGIGIEVKKGKPNYKQVYNQLNKYAQSDEIKALFLVIERYMDLPESVAGKPCFSIGTNKLWGIASK